MAADHLVQGRTPVRPDGVTKPYWDDGGEHDEIRFGDVCLYVYQREAPRGGAFYGGLCGGWFDRAFTDDPERVTCMRCQAVMAVFGEDEDDDADSS